MIVRDASQDDLSSIVKIINSHISYGFNGIFESAPVSVESKLTWFQQFSSESPHQLLIAESDKEILGYTCSFQYRDSCAFDKTVETSIYTLNGEKTKGIGTTLYNTLFNRLRKFDLFLAVVGIALPNEVSVNFHKKFGFEEVGVFKDYAFFNEKFVSSLWMQKMLKTG